jgi:hypothetical protein
MPAWLPARLSVLHVTLFADHTVLCDAVTCKDSTVGLIRDACDSSPDLRAADYRRQLPKVQANRHIRMSMAACKKLLLEFFSYCVQVHWLHEEPSQIQLLSSTVRPIQHSTQLGM